MRSYVCRISLISFLEASSTSAEEEEGEEEEGEEEEEEEEEKKEEEAPNGERGEAEALAEAVTVCIVFSYG